MPNLKNKDLTPFSSSFVTKPEKQAVGLLL